MKYTFDGHKPEVDLELVLQEVEEEVAWYNIDINSEKLKDKEKLLKKKAVIISIK